MSFIRIKSKDVKSIIKATFPDYKKRTVCVEAREKVTLYDLNWSGGTRSEYKACSLDGQPIENKVFLGGPAPWENPFEGAEIPIPEGVAIVEGGFFCGKEKMLYININPANMPKLLN